jgi:hypothetical protein
LHIIPPPNGTSIITRIKNSQISFQGWCTVVVQ